MGNRVEDWSGLEPLRPALRRFLNRRCRDESEVDDVIQETFLRAARYRPSLHCSRRLRAWLMRIAVNVLADNVRRETRWKRVPGGDELLDKIEAEAIVAGIPVVAEGEEPDLAIGGWRLDRPAAIRHLRRAMACLREDDRRVLSSFYSGDGSCSSTGRECSIPIGLVKIRLFRARKRLLRLLRQRVALELGGAARIPEPGRG